MFWVLTVAIRANIIVQPGNNIHSYYRTTATRSNYAPGRFDYAPQLNKIFRRPWVCSWLFQKKKKEEKKTRTKGGGGGGGGVPVLDFCLLFNTGCLIWPLSKMLILSRFSWSSKPLAILAAKVRRYSITATPLEYWTLWLTKIIHYTLLDTIAHSERKLVQNRPLSSI